MSLLTSRTTRGAPLRGGGRNSASPGYAILVQKLIEQGFCVGEDRRPHSPGDGARGAEDQSEGCPDHSELQPHAHAHAWVNPSADGVRGQDLRAVNRA